MTNLSSLSNSDLSNQLYQIILPIARKKPDGFVSKPSGLSGPSDRDRTCGLMVPNAFMMALSAENGFFRPFPPGKPRSSALPSPLFPSAPKR